MWLCLLGGGWICCLVIATQDFRKREIHLVPLIMFGLCGIWLRQQSWGTAFWPAFLTNVLIVGILLSTVLLYFSLQGESRIMDVKLGWGDIVMLLCLAAWLKPFAFLFFYCLLTASLSLVYGLLRRFQLIPPDYPIPLAGWFALGYAGCILLELFK